MDFGVSAQREVDTFVCVSQIFISFYLNIKHSGKKIFEHANIFEYPLGSISGLQYAKTLA